MHKGKKILAIFMSIISLLLLAIFVIDPAISIPGYVSIKGNVTYIEYCKMIAARFMDAINNSISFTSILHELLLFVLQTLILLFEFFIFVRAVVAIFVRNAKCKVIGKIILICLIHGIYLFLLNYDKVSFIPDGVVTFMDKYFNTLKELNINNNFYIMLCGNVGVLILELFRRINIKTNPDERKIETIDLTKFYRDR